MCLIYLLIVFCGRRAKSMSERRKNFGCGVIKMATSTKNYTRQRILWGIFVPNADTQVMYVWLDALVSYISAIGFPDEMETFKKWWPVTQVAGKDNLRQQSAMWQAMLMSANLPPSKQIVIFGFIVSDGQKISKSLGNGISPEEIVSEYGTDVLRYYIARELHPFEDSDMTSGKFKEAYNANLANGLGNLVSRIMKMAEGALSEPVKTNDVSLSKEFEKQIESFEINKACDFIWTKIAEADGYIQKEQPFKILKEDEGKGKEMVTKLVNDLFFIATLLLAILPETSAKIKKLIAENKSPSAPLFPRKD